MKHKHTVLSACACALVALVGAATLKADPGPEPPPTYAASCRWVRYGSQAFLESWAYQLSLGTPLPTLPLWLADALVVPLDLEQSYERTCHDLWIA